jgi:hypothetical protein
LHGADAATRGIIMNAWRPVLTTAAIVAALVLGGCCCVPTTPGGDTGDNVETIGSTMKCDYSQLGQTGEKRVYAWISDRRLAPRCVKLRDDTQNLLRAPREKSDFGTVCPIKMEKIAELPQDAACTPTRIFDYNDSFEVREWNGELVLTIRHGNEARFDIGLKYAQIEGITGVPWLYGDALDGRLTFFVFLEQTPKGNGINKNYRIEVFDREDPKWETTCKYELPRYEVAAEIDCDTAPSGGGQQSDTGGGGEPPLKPR